MLTGKVVDTLSNCSWYIHNHIRHIISFHFGHFWVKFGLICWIVEFCFVFIFSLRHIVVHALSLLALWYWCNILIQLLSFKYDVCHKEFEQKSAAASWNATLSCLLSSHLATRRGQLRMRIASFYELLKISLTLHMWRPLHQPLELLLNIKGPHDLNYIQSQ